MKRKVGIWLVCLGVASLIGALALVCYNSAEERRALSELEYYLPQVIVSIEDVSDEEQTQPTLPEQEEQIIPSDENDSGEMTVKEIDGHGFVGYLSLQTLGLELPVLAQTDDDLLRIAPCRYTGTVNTKDLVIGAHNYRSHFGRLSELSVGDEIRFVDMDGVTTRYRVADLEVLDPFAVEDLTAGEYPLTLFTCTYGGASRVTVRCDAYTS